MILVLVHFVSNDLKGVSHLIGSCMIERKLPLLSFESSSLDPRKGKLHFANIKVAFTSFGTSEKLVNATLMLAFTSFSKTCCQKFVFLYQRLVQRFFFCPPVSPLLIYDTRPRLMYGAFMASNSLR